MRIKTWRISIWARYDDFECEVMKMLKISNLTAGDGEIAILRDISFEIKRGETVSVIGRNGVGKSTLMKAVIGLIPCKAGSVQYDGKDVTRMKAYERAKAGIAFVPQGHGVFPLLTVEENLRMGRLINRKESGKSMEIAYEYFPRLYERRSQNAGTLSGGEQAMLAIGRGLVGRPELLLLDEPSEGIQPSLVLEIGNIVRRCSKELNLTVLLCEQHIGLIQEASQRCYAIDKGSIVGIIEGEKIKDYNELKQYLTV